MNTSKSRWSWTRGVDNVIGILFLPLIVLIFVPIVVTHYLRGVLLRLRWKREYGRSGKHILLVYSQSPNWQEYIESNWLPRLREHAVIVDWSLRPSWRRPFPLEIKAFRHWGGGETEFNPMAIIFPSRGKVRTIRFWQPFRDFKHGKTVTLEEAEKDLFEFVDRLTMNDRGHG